MIKSIITLYVLCCISLNSAWPQSVDVSIENDIAINKLIIRPGHFYRSKIMEHLNEKVKSKKGRINKDGHITFATHRLKYSRIELIPIGISKHDDFCISIKFYFCGKHPYNGKLTLLGEEMKSTISMTDIVDSPLLRPYIQFDFSNGNRPVDWVRLRLRHYKIDIRLNPETDKLETISIEQIVFDNYSEPFTNKVSKS